MESLLQSDFMPHGHCYLWDPYILSLNVGSDALIVFAFTAIPLTLIYFINKRKGLKFRGIFVMFASFIFACGLTHAMGIVTVWHGTYGLQGMVKAATAAISVITAIMLIPLLPKALALRSPEELELANQALAEANAALECEVKERLNVEHTLRESERRFREIADNITEGFWILSADGAQILYASPACDQILGRPILTGRSDYKNWLSIAHPDDKSRLLEDLRNFPEPGELDEEYRILRPDNSIRWIRVKGFCICDDMGDIYRVAGTLEDVTDEHILTEKLSYQAQHDSLTGLINRYEFEKLLDITIQQAHIHNTEHALAYIDLDQFKVINDTCGHAAGDALLRTIADRFIRRLRKGDILARLGGDEFAILFNSCELDQAVSVCQTLRRLLEEQRFIWENKSFSPGASFGIVPINRETRSAHSLLSAADTACYAAKDEGRNRVMVITDPELPDKRRSEMGWISRIQQALENDRFRLAIQRIVPLEQDLQGEHFEILVRMLDSDDSIIYPGAFLPAAERYNIAPRIDRWVIRNTLKWLHDNPERLARTSICSINLSTHSIADPNIIAFISEELSRHSIPAELLCFEITETAAIANIDMAANTISLLRKIGCKFALDDFGSGLTSFSYLKYLEIDFIKIDGLFIREIATDPIDYAMVRSINDVGQVMNIQTIAEFVETDTVLEMLRKIGVNFVQGHALGKAHLIRDTKISSRKVPDDRGASTRRMPKTDRR